MHKLVEYISDLLLLHDCVIIPDFGGFICNYKSARIDEQNGLICPPAKDILFNRNLTHNDGLLANWIANKEGIPYEKANIQVNLFCEELKIRLNQKQRISFGEIGEFYTDRRYNVIFEPNQNNFFAKLCGMGSLEVKCLGDTGLQTQPAPTSSLLPSEKNTHVNIESGNLLHRMFKYALATTAIAGVILLSQSDGFHKNTSSTSYITNSSAIQPDMSAIRLHTINYPVSNVISPLYDYVEYDPLNDLKQE